MDNNTTNFENQFVQTIKSSSQPIVPADAPRTENKSFLPIIISVILSAIIVLQSIALIMLVNTNSSIFNNTDDEVEETEDDTEQIPYVYDDSGFLVALSANCKSSDGSSFFLTLDNSFEEYDTSSTLVDSGKYSINRNSVFTFNRKSGDKTLFYDGYQLTDGTVFYNCEEEPDEESQEE